MKVPEGLPHPSNHVCKLKKSLYGLKQASRQWFAKLTFELVHQGFTQSKNDYSLFIKHTADSFILAIVYVDDIILTGNDIQSIQQLKSHLHRTFSIKDLGSLSFFLGLEVTYLPMVLLLLNISSPLNFFVILVYQPSRQSLLPCLLLSSFNNLIIPHLFLIQLTIAVSWAN